MNFFHSCNSTLTFFWHLPTQQGNKAMNRASKPTSSEVSLTEYCQAASPEIDAWLKQCPNPTDFANHVVFYLWLNTTGTCYQCGDPFLHKELRHDVDGYWSNGELICRGCWFWYEGGTPANPEFEQPPWPEHYVPLNEVQLYDGVLVDLATGAEIGTVKGYNPASGFCKLVTRFGFEDCAEGGSIMHRDEKVIRRVPVYESTSNMEGLKSLYAMLTAQCRVEQ